MDKGKMGEVFKGFFNLFFKERRNLTWIWTDDNKYCAQWAEALEILFFVQIHFFSVLVSDLI